MIREAMKLGPMKKECRRWPLVEVLLLDPNLHIPNALTLRGMLKGWKASSKALALDFCENSIPKTATLNHVMTLYQCNSCSNDATIQDLIGFISNHAIKTMTDLQDKNHG